MSDKAWDNSPLFQDIGEIVISEQEIQARVSELGAQISADYAGKRPLLVGVLRGVFVFMADLVRATTIPIEVDFIGITRPARALCGGRDRHGALVTLHSTQPGGPPAHQPTHLYHVQQAAQTPL